MMTIVVTKSLPIILHTVLDTNCAPVKIQVFELMSALCCYSEKGYKLSLDALEDYKVYPDASCMCVQVYMKCSIAIIIDS